MAKAKNSADPTAKKATRSRKTVEAAVVGASSSRGPEFANLEDRIRARAYELYQSRNGLGGSPEADWSQAEAEIRGMFERTA